MYALTLKTFLGALMLFGVLSCRFFSQVLFHSRASRAPILSEITPLHGSKEVVKFPLFLEMVPVMQHLLRMNLIQCVCVHTLSLVPALGCVCPDFSQKRRRFSLCAFLFASSSCWGEYLLDGTLRRLSRALSTRILHHAGEGLQRV